MSENRTSDGVDLPAVAVDQQDTIKICPRCLSPIKDGRCTNDACDYVAAPREERQG